ncbi:hypothetical protein EVAR_49755_1 [Eumeta japonica]|uniref:Uncharacterized protein n=1 Tax=Eumeta variegata TaxID=151549 RepID=A0A4C1YB45_EUMVA|nr:hypothetical protein EVAR_49755_1 [Eumeta japonica]
MGKLKDACADLTFVHYKARNSVVLKITTIERKQYPQSRTFLVSNLMIKSRITYGNKLKLTPDLTVARRDNLGDLIHVTSVTHRRTPRVSKPTERAESFRIKWHTVAIHSNNTKRAAFLGVHIQE